jgi:hypothetical protein
MRWIKQKDIFQPATFLWQEEGTFLRVVQPGTGRNIFLGGLITQVWCILSERKQVSEIAHELGRPWDEISAVLEQLCQLRLIQKSSHLLE